MSVSVRDACLEEGPILNLIREYFELAGHAECLVTLENYSKSSEQWQLQLPLEIAALREMALRGKWNQVITYLDVFNDTEDTEGLRKCRYAAHRQKYLEILYHVEDSIRSKLRLGFSYYENGELLSHDETKKMHEVMETQLTALKPLVPSLEEYTSLQALISLPSISSSKEFSEWKLHSGRLETFHKIGEWVSKILYLNVKFPSKHEGGQVSGLDKSCTLLRLLAKGLLYEQCEQLCRARCGESEGVSNMLDLGSWIQQQPDSSFQLSPSELCLVVTTWSKPIPPELLSVNTSATDKEKGTLLLKNSTVSRSISTLQVTEQTGVAETKTPVESKSGQQKERSGIEANTSCLVEEQSSTGDKDEVKSSKTAFRGDTCRTVADSTVTTSNSCISNDKTLVHAETSNTEPAIVDVKDLKVPEIHFNSSPPNNNGQLDFPNLPLDGKTFLPSTTPLLKTGRDSSTPINIKSSRASLKSSPPPSPIASNLAASHQISSNTSPPSTAGIPVVASVKENRARKCIDFCKNESIEWPTASLLSTLSDAQVVRSVAFSGSGKFVAVGANSRMLRVCSTTSLLEKKENTELSLLYQHPHYHKSSIYCMTWLGDTLLASGSNDQSIRLLTCLSDTVKPEFKLQKPLPIHKGTIRDIVFTHEGLLASGGGGGSPEIKITDVNTCQIVTSLVGHTDQVLSLGILPKGLLASGSQDKSVLLWDLRSHLPIATLHPHLGTASLTSHKENLVTSHLDGTCFVHDLNTFQCVSTYSPHSSECRTVRYCPKTNSRDCSWLLSGSYDGTICLADTETLQWTKLCQHAGKVIQCRWHPQGNIFASTGTDKKAHFWTLE